MISLVLAVTAALWARRASQRARRVLDATTYMRIILPETVIALGLFLLLRREDVELGVATIVIGHVVFNSAYATVVIQARMATLTDTLEQAAADLGAHAVARLPARDAPADPAGGRRCRAADLLVLVRRRGHVALPRRHRASRRCPCCCSA